jgi:RNA polymerase sigma-70 factor (ECF subfamily)
VSPAALEALFLRHERSLHATVRRWIRDPEDAAEIVQETFVRVWTSRERLREETAAAYLYRSALHLAVSRMRWRRVRRALRHKVEEDAVARPPEDAVLDRERVDAVRAALGDLPEDLRRVVELRDVTELSYAEIAGILDIKEGTVGSRRHAALARLRTALAVAAVVGVLAAALLRPRAPDPTEVLLRGVEHPALVEWGRSPAPDRAPGVRIHRVATFTGS